MKTIAYSIAAVVVSTNAFAHGGHPEMAQASVHGVHHALEALAYIGLGIGIGLAVTALTRKFRGRS